MRNEHFDVPVTLAGDGRGRGRLITDTVQAAEILLDQWPKERRGPKYRAALRVCMEVMEQRRPVSSARRAFIAAAKEARIAVREER